MRKEDLSSRPFLLFNSWETANHNDKLHCNTLSCLERMILSNVNFSGFHTQNHPII